MISSGPAYVVCKLLVCLLWQKLMKCRPCRQHPHRVQLPIFSLSWYQIPSDVSIHWNISIGRWTGSLYRWFGRSCVLRLGEEEHTQLLFNCPTSPGQQEGYGAPACLPICKQWFWWGREPLEWMGQRVGRLWRKRKMYKRVNVSDGFEDSGAILGTYEEGLEVDERGGIGLSGRVPKINLFSLMLRIVWYVSNISSGLSMLSSKSEASGSSSCVARPYSMKGSISGRVWPSKEFSGTGELPLTLVEDRFLFNEHRWLSIATVMQTLSCLRCSGYLCT